MDAPLHDLLAGIARDEFFAARDRGETMYQASDRTADKIIEALVPFTLQLHDEVQKLLAQWEDDRRGYPTDEDWRAGIADSTLKLCINELRNATERAARRLVSEAV
jgi:hypothetical protein